MLAHAVAAFDLLVVELTGSRGGIGGVTHLSERPGQVHSCRPGRKQHRGSGVQILTTRRGEGIPVRRGDADRRRAPHRHAPDRLGDFSSRTAFELDLLVGKAALVEQDDAVVLEPQNLRRL